MSFNWVRLFSLFLFVEYLAKDVSALVCIFARVSSCLEEMTLDSWPTLRAEPLLSLFHFPFASAIFSQYKAY